jgi:hypothetical protein
MCQRCCIPGIPCPEMWGYPRPTDAALAHAVREAHQKLSDVTAAARAAGLTVDFVVGTDGMLFQRPATPATFQLRETYRTSTSKVVL